MYQAAVLNKSKLNPYLTNQILNASPEELFIKVFDFAVVSSEKKDLIKTNTAIQELINFLRFDDDSTKELAVNLIQLYQFCQEQARKRNFEIVTTILIELRESWIKAIENR